MNATCGKAGRRRKSSGQRRASLSFQLPPHAMYDSNASSARSKRRRVTYCSIPALSPIGGSRTGAMCLHGLKVSVTETARAHRLSNSWSRAWNVPRWAGWSCIARRALAAHINSKIRVRT
eukprot:6466969-Prymnesium_polylepis.2